MPEWGKDRQSLLADARVAVIGAGGVKATLLLSLVSSGIGYIKLIEFDVVEKSNLNRQILYRTSDIGLSKGQAALKTLQDLNNEIKIKLIEQCVDEENINTLLSDVDFIVEGGNSPYGRNLVNLFCLQNKTPMMHCSAQFNYGYVFSVVPENKTACFACIFPEEYTRKAHTGAVPVSVLSTSIAGSLGAAEVLKWFLGYKDKLIVNGKKYFNSLLLSGDFGFERIDRNLICPICSKYYA